MTKGKKTAIIALILTVLITLPAVYFGFINDKTYVSIRMAMAERLMEKENYEKAEALYRKVLDRDDHQKDAYLGLGQIYLKDARYANAIELLKRAVDVTGDKETFTKDLTSAAIGRSGQLIEKEEPKSAIELLEKLGDDYIGFEEIRTELGNAYLARAEQIRDGADLHQSLTFLTGADPEKVDFEVFRQYRIDGFLVLGEEAVASDDLANARQYYNMVLLLDPENAEALAAIEQMGGTEEQVNSYTIRGNGATKLYATLDGGLKISVPVDIHFEIHYDGADPEKAVLYYTVNAEASMIGMSYDINKEGYVSAEYGERYERESNGPWYYYTLSGDPAETAEEIFTSYEQLAHEGAVDANTIVYNDQGCKIIRDHKTGSNYRTLFNGADLGKFNDVLAGLDIASVRYISLETDHVVHVEADLSGSDFDTLFSQTGISGYLGMDANISVGTFQMAIDVEAINATNVDLPPDVYSSAQQPMPWGARQ